MKLLEVEFASIKYRRPGSGRSGNYPVRRLFGLGRTFVYSRVSRSFVVNNTKRFIIYILTDYKFEINE